MDTNFILSIISLGVAIFLALIVCLYKINGKLSNIQENTSVLSEIRIELTKLTERIDMALRYGIQPAPKGTATLTLKNLRKVEVTAEPNEKETIYYIEVEEPVLKTGFIVKKSKETKLATKEKELFGKEPQIRVYDARRMVLRVPSTDPRICAEYVSLFLKWLDTDYWGSLKELEEYEKIAV